MFVLKLSTIVARAVRRICLSGIYSYPSLFRLREMMLWTENARAIDAETSGRGILARQYLLRRSFVKTRASFFFLLRLKTQVSKISFSVINIKISRFVFLWLFFGVAQSWSCVRILLFLTVEVFRSCNTDHYNDTFWKVKVPRRKPLLTTSSIAVRTKNTSQEFDHPDSRCDTA